MGEKKLVSTALNNLAPSYGTFVTSLTIMLRAAPISFDELVGLVLQEEQRTSNFVHLSRKGKQALLGEKGKFQPKGGNFQMHISPRVRVHAKEKVGQMRLLQGAWSLCSRKS